MKELPPAFSEALERIRARKAASESSMPPPVAETPLETPQTPSEQPTAETPPRPANDAVDDPDEVRGGCYKPPKYLPTPEAIREACLAIQATWSKWERQTRGGIIHHWTVPMAKGGAQ